MKKSLAVVLLVVLSLIGYSAAVILSFGSAWYSVISAGNIVSKYCLRLLCHPRRYLYIVFSEIVTTLP